MAETSGSGRSPRGNGQPSGNLWQRLRGLVKARQSEAQLRETLEEIIDEIKEVEGEEEVAAPISSDERVMLSNILRLRHLTAYDVMVPRADIVAVDLDTPIEALIDVMSEAGHSRLPVYRETLDEVVGIVHIKDVLTYMKGERTFDLVDLVRRILVVAPSMRVLDLLLEMRLSRVHMALVVDEFGGIDGLVTIEDLVEEIVGEIDDEHDVAEGPKLIDRPDGSLVADARTTIEEFEEKVGPVLSDEEREDDIDTLGGLLFSLAGRVPGRGELVEHDHSGMSFEVLEADPRRVKRLRVHNVADRLSRPGDDG
ncbi:HlyC/CorC family transporter [Pelagibius litoralis]|uniref:HlyC/CorC family transporter n=1 Tax=Pelagibius litoralis TaxID=374515 RepID=A0A967F2V4_9PROT|nr:hemolysin family protein [Pelagibius litoralis]NIA72159.1 HlyC/CorC family transporter [Pelagibius litoralis]